MEHQTPLTYHIKDRHFWFDVAVLACLFGIAVYYPLLKIIPLVASLELISFFSFHFLAKSSHIQVQGFVGGLVSSTVVYLQILNDRKFSRLGARDLQITLLFALCAMLCECLFIMWVIAGNIGFTFYLPFLSQLVFCLFLIIFLFLVYPADDDGGALDFVDTEILIDHPIVWKTVARFSLFVLVLVFSFRFIGSELGLSENLSTFFVSLFEAHAILASVLTSQREYGFDSSLMELIFFILLGNAVSKSFLVFRGGNLDKKWAMIGFIFSALLFSVLCTFAWDYLIQDFIV